MSWGNPWALLGLAALALPVLIHMLGRRQARTLPFPTLRFLAPTRLQPIRRTIVQDPVLLVVRLGVLASAVVALAQPRFDQGEDAGTVSALARVVIVDTSASMRRPAEEGDIANGESAAEVARREARQIAAEARASVIVETASPSAELAGANSWLVTQPGPGDIVILSDFQSGTLDFTALAAVTPAFGIDLRRIAVEVTTAPVETTARSAGAEIVARAIPTADGVAVEWTVRPAAAIATDGVSLLTDEADAEAVRRTAAAAWRALTDLSFDPGHPIAVVYEGYESRGALLRGAQAPAAPWMAEVIRRVHRDPLLAAAAVNGAEARREPDVALSPADPFVRIGNPTVRGTVAASAAIDGRDHLVFFTSAAPPGLVSAALIGAIGRASKDRPAVAELDPAVIADPELESWRRAPAVRTAAVSNDAASDGRWFWLVALVLLGVETLSRHRTDASRHRATGAAEEAS